MSQCFRKTRITEFKGLLIVGSDLNKTIGKILGLSFDSNMNPIERPAYFNRLLDELGLRPDRLSQEEMIWMASTDALVKWFNRSQLNTDMGDDPGEHYFHGMVLYGSHLNVHNLNQALGVRVAIVGGEVLPLSIYGSLRNKFNELQLEELECSGNLWRVCHRNLEQWREMLREHRRAEEERRNVS